MAQPIGLKAIMDVKDFSKGQKAYENGLSSMQGKTEKTTKGLSSLLKGAGAVALGVFGAKMIQGVVKGVKEMVSAAAEIPGVASAFEGLGGSIEKMREGSLGMVTDIDLMKSFNSAAQLVSTDFAQKLPDAMGYLSKVSAATGQDMGFMVDSLVKGVGRLSPMILDNLGIQVNATEANEAYAKQLGKSATELTKTEQQAAMMNLVMEKLAANTAAMPDILGTTNQQLASMKAMSQNLKNEIGKGLQPVIGALLAPVLKLGMFALPMVGKAAEKTGKWIAGALTKGIETATGAVEDILSLLSEFKGGFDAGGGGLQGILWGIGEALDNFIPEDAMNKIWDVFDGIQLVADKIKAIPASFSLGSAFSSITGRGAITGGLAAVLGMLGLPPDIVSSFAEAGTLVESTIRTTLDKIKTGFATGGVGGIFDALLPAGGDTATMLAPILDPLKALGTEVQRVITEALAAFDAEGIKGLFNSVLGNAFDLLGVFTKSKNDLIGGLMTLGGTLLTTLGEAFPELQPIIDTFLKPALEIGKRIFDAIVMVKGEVTQAALGLFTSLTEDAPAALAVLPETINSILTTAIGLFETLFPVILDVINAVIPVALAIVETMAPVFATAFEVVGNIVADVMPVVSDIIGLAAAFIEERMPQIADIITTTLEIIQELWNAVWPVLQTVIEEVWPVIEAVVGGALDFLQGILNTVLLLIKGDFIGAFDSLKETILGLAENIENILVVAFEAILNIITPVAEFLKNVFVGAWEAVQLIIGKLVDKELGRAKEWIDKVRDSIEKAEEWCGKIAGGFERIAGKLADLISPIKTAIDWLSKLKVPDVLKPGSPSPFEVSLVGIGQALKSTGKMFAEFAMGMSGTQAKNFKEVTKGVNELVGAFADLLDLMVRLNAQPTGMDMTGLTAFLGKFENAIYAVMGVVDRLLNSIGYKRLKLLDKAAKYFKQIFDNVLINFKDISTAPVPDMNTFKENIIAVGVAIVQALQGMVAITGQNSLNQAARFAEIAEEVFAFIKSAIDVLKDMADYDLTVSMEAKVANMLDRLWEIVPPFVLFAQRFAGIALETANSIYVSMTGIVSFIKPALDALTELAKYVAQESVADQVENMLALLGEIVPALVTFAADFEQEALDAANEVFTAVKGLVSIIKTALDAIKALSEYVMVTSVKAAVENVSARLTEIVDVLADAADITKTQGYFAAAEYYGAVKGMIEIVKTAIDVIKAVSEFEQIGSIQEGAQNLIMRLTSLVYILADAADVTKTEGYKAASAYYDSTSGMLSIIKPAIDAIAAIIEYVSVEGLGWATSAFTRQFTQFVVLLAQAANIAATDGYTAASAYYAATSGIISIVKPGIDAIAAVLSYKPSVDVGMQTAIFIIQFTQFLTLLKNVANIAATEAYQAASDFYAATRGIVDFVKPASDALAAILAYVGRSDLASKAKRFGIDMLTMLVELRDSVVDLSTEGYQAASDFFTATAGIIGFIQPAIDALAALGAYASVVGLRFKAEWFRVDVMFVMDKIKLMARQFVDDGLEEAKVFGAAVTRTAEILSNAVGMLTTVLGYASSSGLRSAMTRLKNDLSYILDQIGILARDFNRDAIADAVDLSNGVIEMTGALDIALDAFADTVAHLQDLPAAGDEGVRRSMSFRRSVASIVDNIRSAMDNITQFMSGRASGGRSWGATFQDNVRNALDGAISLLRSKYPAWAAYWGKYKDDIDAVTKALKKMHEEAAKALVIGGGGGEGGGVGPEGPDSPTASDRSGGMGGNGGDGPGLRGQSVFGRPVLAGAGAGSGSFGNTINVTVNLGGTTISNQLDAARLADFIGQTVAQRLRR